jgi:hypothetical protein
VSIDSIIAAFVPSKNHFAILVPRLAALGYEYYASSDDGLGLGAVVPLAPKDVSALHQVLVSSLGPSRGTSLRNQ